MAAGLWLWGLRGQPLFLDEAASWWVASQDEWSEFWRLAMHQEVAPPPFYLGLRLIVEGLGADGHAAMRLPVVALTLPAVPLAAILARQCGGRPLTVVLAAWLTALSPLLLTYAQQARGFGIAVTAGLLATVLLLRAQDQDWPPRATLLAGIAMGLAPWTHYVVLVPLAVIVVGTARSWLRPVRWRFVIPALAGWVTALIVAAVQYDHVGAGMDGITRLGGEDLRRVLATGWDGRYLFLPVIGWIALAGLLLALVIVARGTGRARTIALAGLAGPTVIVLISALGPDIVTTRYLVPAVPFLLVAVALATQTWRPLVGVAVALAIVGGWGVLRAQDSSTGGNFDTETIIQGVVPDLRPGTVVSAEEIYIAAWFPPYVAERNGINGVRFAWGGGATAAAACDRRRIIQILPATADLQAATGFWRDVFAYRTTIRPHISPDRAALIAEPAGPRPQACDGVQRVRY
ncbi:MAG: hypothetical protein M0P31_14510 [Solirubrobacteraceae bacterium]|nr:hypothetical protein [Solirubrobacteraceae bacterium]